MDVILTDSEIKTLISQPKKILLEFDDCFDGMKPKKGHTEFDYTINNSDGSCFIVKLRQSIHNGLNFSAILAYRLVNTNTLVILTRYNGKNHYHRNPIEKTAPFYDFHIHLATERYQSIRGRKAEHYAVKTDRYSSLREAFECLISDCNVSLNQGIQLNMFK
jgi:hypothetical protein